MPADATPPVPSDAASCVDVFPAYTICAQPSDDICELYFHTLGETSTCDAVCAELAPLFALIDGDFRDELFWIMFQNAFGIEHTIERITPMNAANL